MPIRIQCPHCRREFRVPDETAGKAARCQSCSQAFRIPVPPPRPILASAVPATPHPLPPGRPTVSVNPPASSSESLLAEDAAAAPLPLSAQPPRPVAAPTKPRLSSSTTSRPRGGGMDVAALALLVPIAQFLIGLPLAYTAGSFALTATYESEEQCLTVLFCAAVGLLMFLSGVFNWKLFFYYGRFGRITRHLGPHVTRSLYVFLGTSLIAILTIGSSNSRPFSERMWPLNGPVIEEALPDHMPKPKTGPDRMRAPGARRPPGF